MELRPHYVSINVLSPVTDQMGCLYVRWFVRSSNREGADVVERHFLKRNRATAKLAGPFVTFIDGAPIYCGNEKAKGFGLHLVLFLQRGCAVRPVPAPMCGGCPGRVILASKALAQV